MCTEWDTPVCQGNCIILCYVYDYFFLPQRNLQEAKQKLEKKKAKVRTYSLIFFGQSVNGKECYVFAQKLCFSNSIQILKSKFKRASPKWNDKINEKEHVQS